MKQEIKILTYSMINNLLIFNEQYNLNEGKESAKIKLYYL